MSHLSKNVKVMSKIDEKKENTPVKLENIPGCRGITKFIEQ